MRPTLHRVCRALGGIQAADSTSHLLFLVTAPGGLSGSRAFFLYGKGLLAGSPASSPFPSACSTNLQNGKP